jgi:outer membrane biosynthesis protein TonB
VRIRVQIDAQGAVTKVTPIAPNAINFRMVDAAAAAARFWVFEPAKTEGHPVPSEMILEFHFGGR